MPQFWAQPWPPFHLVDAAAYNTSVTLTDVSRPPQKQFAAYTLQKGSEFELVARGNFSTTGTPTLLLGFYYGGVAGVALAASAAITTGTTAASWPWYLYYNGRVRDDGVAGSINGMGYLMLGTSLTAFAAPAPIPTTLALRTVTIDTTIVKNITVGAQWGTNSVSNSLVCNDLSVRMWY